VPLTSRQGGILRQRLLNVWHSAEQRVNDASIDNWQQACMTHSHMHADGGRFEHTL